MYCLSTFGRTFLAFVRNFILMELKLQVQGGRRGAFSKRIQSFSAPFEVLLQTSATILKGQLY